MCWVFFLTASIMANNVVFYNKERCFCEVDPNSLTEYH